LKRCRLLPEATGSQLLEFALVLPFLLVLLTGIIDFGYAFNLKQKLNNAAREGARLAATEEVYCSGNGQAPCIPAPDSVQAVRDEVANYLTNAGLNGCVVATTATYAATNQAWTYSSSSTGCNSFSLKVETGFTYANGGTTVVASRVTLSYPYAWVFFNRIIGLLVSGSSYGSSITITTDAIMQNLP
jgi:Flp pilus assembly protein TadG